MTRGWWRVLGAFLALALVAAACGDDDDAAGPIDEEVADPEGVLKVGVDLLAQGGLKFDPATMGAGQYIQTLPVLRTLLVRNPDGTLRPDLAESAEIVDPSTVSVTLRPSMKFSDGSALDSAAVKATFDRNLASNNSRGLQIPDMQQVASITIDSPTEFTIKLKQPFAAVVYALLAGVEFAPMAPAQFTTGNIDTKAIGAGPMRIVSYEPGVRVVFEKNPNYWDARNILLKGMEFVHVTAGAATANALQAGQIDVAAIEHEQIAAMTSPLEGDAAIMNAPLTLQLCIKDDNPLGDLNVRKAIAHAFDRDAFNDAIFDGDSAPAWDLWPSDSPYHNEDLDEIYEHDVAKAKDLIAKSKWASGVKFNVLISPGPNQRQMEVVQAQLKEAGIEMGIVLSQNTGQDFQGLVKELASWSQSRPGPLDKISRFYLSNSFSNACKYPVPKVDALYAELAGLELESDEAVEVWQEIQAEIFEELAFFPQMVFQINSWGYNTDRIGEIVPYINQLGSRSVDPVGTYIKA